MISTWPPLAAAARRHAGQAALARRLRTVGGRAAGPLRAGFSNAAIASACCSSPARPGSISSSSLSYGTATGSTTAGRRDARLRHRPAYRAALSHRRHRESVRDAVPGAGDDRGRFVLGARCDRLFVLMMIAAATISFFHHPLPWPQNLPFKLPWLYSVGIWAAVTVSAAFIAIYPRVLPRRRASSPTLWRRPNSSSRANSI